MKDVILYEEVAMREYFSKPFISLLEGLLRKKAKNRLTLE